MAEEGVIFVRKATGLVREVGALGSMSLPICYAVGAGINLFTAQAIGKYPHTNVTLAIIIGGIPIVCLAIAMGLMTICMPRTGGMYLFVSRTINPVVAMLGTWGYIWSCLMAYGIVCYVCAVFWGFGFFLVGTATGNAALLAIGSTLSKPIYSLALGLAIAIFWWIMTLTGMTYMSKILNVFMVIPLVASLLGISYMFAAAANPHSLMTAWDNVFGAGAWDAILTVASNHGWSPTSPEYGMYPMEWTATWYTSIVAVWAYAGIEAASFIGSEVKSPSRTMIFGGVIAPIFVMVLYTLMGFSLVSAYGPFVSAYEFIAGITPGSPGPDVLWPEVQALCPTYPDSPPLASLPLFQSVYAAGLGHTASAAAIAFATALWLFNGPPAFMVAASRVIFAGAFDRLFPEKLAAVNDRFHSPHWAITLSAVVGIAYTIMNYFGHWPVIVASEPMMVIGYLIASIAAMLFPFVRQDVWERGRKLTIGPIPVITLLGAIATPFFLYQTFLSIAALSKGLTGMVFYTGFYFLMALIITISYAYNVRRGINVRLIYSEIPPA